MSNWMMIAMRQPTLIPRIAEATLWIWGEMWSPFVMTVAGFRVCRNSVASHVPTIQLEDPKRNDINCYG